jgi:hypothetical protein
MNATSMAAANGGKSISFLILLRWGLKVHLLINLILSIHSYAQSDYTTREESQAQKKMQGVAYDSYGKATYEDVMGNTNKGSSYWVSPEGQKFTLTWTADDAGF